MTKNSIIKLENVFIDVHRKTKTKDIPHELYFISYNSLCGLHAVKVNKKETLDCIYDHKNINGNTYLDFGKYEEVWEVNEILGDTNTICKEDILERYDFTK